MPFEKIQDWIEQEKQRGCAFPERGILATTNKDAIPHSRVVALREITSEGILFFTQRGTRKVEEMLANPVASMTIWLAMQQRQIIADGTITALTDAENHAYWSALPRDRQLRFCAYAPTSSQRIQNLEQLNEQLNQLTEQYFDKPIPCSPHYLGFRLQPKKIYFYTLGGENFSEVIHYVLNGTSWSHYLVSP